MRTRSRITPATIASRLRFEKRKARVVMLEVLLGCSLAEAADVFYQNPARYRAAFERMA